MWTDLYLRVVKIGDSDRFQVQFKVKQLRRLDLLTIFDNSSTFKEKFNSLHFNFVILHFNVVPNIKDYGDTAKASAVCESFSKANTSFQISDTQCECCLRIGSHRINANPKHIMRGLNNTNQNLNVCFGPVWVDPKEVQYTVVPLMVYSHWTGTGK